MGTSKRNLNNDIKKLLKAKPLSAINETAPVISKKILTKNTLKEKFDQEEVVENSIKIITRQFISLNSNGFKGKTKKEIIEDPISQQEFLEMILDEIENTTIINSRILEKALKIVMCEFLENSEFDVYSFAQILFYQIIYEVLLEQLYDNIKDAFEEISYNLIENMIKNATNQIMNQSIYEKVNSFIDRKISLDLVLGEISRQTSKATFGEF